jgi:photosystem II stability/assembly factor-like uncharacterized protein
VPTLHVAMENVLLILRESADKWTLEEQLGGMRLQCVAVDPSDGERVYVGTDDRGLWLSLDGGRSWGPAGAGIRWSDVTAVAVGGRHVGGPATVYAGTEPSAVFRSTDEGESWEELDGLTRLPSAPTWSFPPRPDTHHVRWIAIDPHDALRLYVAIEAGALVRSLDGGDTWIDRVEDGPYDTHTLALHPVATERLYSAAGDGYYESRDAGRTWDKIESGLGHGYLFGVAVDPADPERVVISAASGPGRAYSASTADSYMYVKNGNGPWAPVRDGLPEPRGTTITVFATSPQKPHAIYAANNRGIFHSRDAGWSWERLHVPWSERLERQSAQGLALETSNNSPAQTSTR